MYLNQAVMRDPANIPQYLVLIFVLFTPFPLNPLLLCCDGQSVPHCAIQKFLNEVK